MIVCYMLLVNFPNWCKTKTIHAAQFISLLLVYLELTRDVLKTILILFLTCGGRDVDSNKCPTAAQACRNDAGWLYLLLLWIVLKYDYAQWRTAALSDVRATSLWEQYLCWCRLAVYGDGQRELSLRSELWLWPHFHCVIIPHACLFW